MKPLLALCHLLLACTAQAESWRFAVIGDTPYNSYEVQEYPKLIEQIEAESPELIIHVGDFKASNARCSDDLFESRHNLLNATNLPFIYIPGDNEWTDCKRLAAGNHDQTERLNKLRKLFFSTPFSLGQRRLPVEQQSAAFPEHLRWRLGPVLMVTLNVPGPNNNFGMGHIASQEFLERNPVLIDWLKQAFATARRENSAGLVLALQGNPGFKHFAAGLAHEGYRELLEVLLYETIRFSGQVLFIHGDTHWQRIDHPLRHPVTGERIPNFTRLESFGHPFLGWVKVHIDSDSPTLFRFETHAYKPGKFQ